MDYSIFYALCFWLSLIVLVTYVCTGLRKNANHVIMLAIVTIANGGYLALAISQNLQEAILANKLTYVGGCFFPVVVFLIVCELCNVKLHRMIVFLMYTLQSAMFACVCTIGYSNIYYETVKYHMDIEHNVAFLTKTYGFAHSFYLVTLCVYFAAAFIVLLYSLKKKSAVSYKTLAVLFINSALLVGIYVGERMWDLNMELMPFGYTMSFLSLTYILTQKDTYSISEYVYKMLEQNAKCGYLCVDKKLRYKGANDYLIDLFPDLKKLSLDKKIPNSGALIYQKINWVLDQIEKGAAESERVIRSGARYYSIRVNLLKKYRGVLFGYILELLDVTDNQNHLKMIEDYNKNLESEVNGKTQKIKEIQDRIIMSMAQMIESRDLSTGGHIKRTSSVVRVFSRRLFKSNMGFSQDFLYYVERSAPMHDLGKIAVDDVILRKQGRFTDEEYNIMKKHSEAGAGIVRNILAGVETEEFVEIAVNVAHYHHEKVDGTGYPKGLKGDEIPCEARIMALVDVFDALVSKRCYKDSFSYDKAASIIEESMGSHFDEALARVFLECRSELESLYNEFAE